MPFQLSKRDQVQKTELLAEARERYSELCGAIEAFNATVEAAGGAVRAAADVYGRAVAELKAFTAGVACDQAAALKANGRAGRRRQLRDGVHVQDWIDAYASFAPPDPVIGLPGEVEQPDEGLLTDFEELPDSP